MPFRPITNKGIAELFSPDAGYQLCVFNNQDVANAAIHESDFEIPLILNGMETSPKPSELANMIDHQIHCRALYQLSDAQFPGREWALLCITNVALSWDEPMMRAVLEVNRGSNRAGYDVNDEASTFLTRFFR